MNLTTNNLIKLNIRGFKYEILRSKLKIFPQTSRLFCLQKEEINSTESVLLCDYYDQNSNQFYFDRDPFIFNSILSFNTKNLLHFNNNECVSHLFNELNYWFNNHKEEYEKLIDYCCKYKYFSQLDSLNKDLEFKEEAIQEYHTINKTIDYGVILPKLREKLWFIIDKPTSSYTAILFFIISMLVLFLTIIVFILISLPENKITSTQSLSLINSTITSTNSSTNLLVQSDFMKISIRIQYFCLAWFTFEFLLTFIVSPFKKTFFFDIYNIIDIVTIISYYLISFWQVNSYLIMVFIFRLVLLFKITKISINLQSLAITLKNSFKELIILLVYLIILILIFSFLVYFSENIYSGPSSNFLSIPYTFW